MANGAVKRPTRGPVRAGRSMAFEDALPVKLRRASDVLEEVVRLLLGDVHGLGFTEVRLLGYLAERPSAPLSEISRDLRVDKAWIWRLLRALKARGLTAEERDSSDPRIVLASLTDAGRALYRQISSDAGRCNAEILAGVDEALAGELMDRLEANLRRVALQLRSQSR